MFLLPLLLVACGSSPTDPPASEPESNRSGSEPAGQSVVELEADTAPLLQIMIQLEQNMQAAGTGLWRHDFDLMENAADQIANHPKIPDRQLQTLKQILGPDRFESFVEDDQRVHRQAVEMREAAGQEDFNRVAEAYIEIQRGCVSCHQAHRETIRQHPDW